MLHPDFIHFTSALHPVYIYFTCNLYPVNIHFTSTLHPVYTHFTSILHPLCIQFTSTLHPVYNPPNIKFTSTLNPFYILSLFTLHLLKTHRASTVCASITPYIITTSTFDPHYICCHRHVETLITYLVIQLVVKKSGSFHPGKRVNSTHICSGSKLIIH